MKKFYRKALKFIIDIFTAAMAIVCFISLGTVDISALWPVVIFAASWAWLFFYAWAKGWMKGGADE